MQSSTDPDQLVAEEASCSVVLTALDRVFILFFYAVFKSCIQFQHSKGKAVLWNQLKFLWISVIWPFTYP